MRSLVSDCAYFEFLDEKAGDVSSTFIASVHLLEAFPNLRREEAKAVYQDWKSARFNKRAVLG